MARKTELPAPVRTTLKGLDYVISVGAFFLAVCLCSAATSKSMAFVLIVLTLASAFLFWERLRDRLTAPIIALALFVLMDIVSSLYAASGKFAMYEVLKVVKAFCLALLLLAFIGNQKPERKAAVILEGCAAIAGLVSIDLLSTRWVSTPVLSFLGLFTTDYMDPDVVEEGVRMISIFMNPNVFAGCMGIGVLLSLGLAVSAEKPAERAPHLVLLSINALAFVLAFSMGACMAIVPAFLLLLALTGSERRTALLILMVETLLVTAACAFPISLTSMTEWTGVRPIPLLCSILGAAALCALDLLAGRRLAARLAGHGKAVLYLVIALLAALVVFVIAACALTTGVTLLPGDSLRRSAYPAPGSYTLTAETDGDPTVIIQSQNRADTMMHAASTLYSGPLSMAEFTVPEDSLVVWFQFSTSTPARLDAAAFTGDAGSGTVPLGYRLLPGFIANRLQGLRANQNAIQRFVFFEDGFKLFLRSPIIGSGLGAFENGVRGVQTFRYDTRYAHNHYIQTLAETGIVGLALFLILLVVSALAIWRGRKRPLAPALGGALIFMSIHAMVEFTFSTYCYLPLAFGVFAVISLSCGDMVPLPAWAQGKPARNGLAGGVCALLVAFWVLLGCNITAQNLVTSEPTLEHLEEAAALDPFERADYMLSYVVWITGTSADEETRQKADKYAARLEKIDSNIIPFYLAEYYLWTGRTDRGLEMAERYVSYVSSDADVWLDTFELLEKYEQDTDAYRAGVSHIADLLDAWNEENMGYIELDDFSLSFIARMRS